MRKRLKIIYHRIKRGANSLFCPPGHQQLFGKRKLEGRLGGVLRLHHVRNDSSESPIAHRLPFGLPGERSHAAGKSSKRRFIAGRLREADGCGCCRRGRPIADALHPVRVSRTGSGTVLFGDCQTGSCAPCPALGRAQVHQQD
jgi:hypothetical protein